LHQFADVHIQRLAAKSEIAQICKAAEESSYEYHLEELIRK
jgi:hypothetical protein